MRYITKQWMNAHDAIIQNKLQPLSDAAIVKTLSSVPTESTLTYLIGQVSHNFQIGDEVRVADTDGYVYYKLYDINNGSAIWNKLGGGDSVLASTIKVTLQSIVNGNVTAGTDLNGVTVSVQNITDDNTSAVTKQWYGNELTFDNLTPTKQYTISVSSVNGYSQPTSYTTSALGLGETASQTFQYEANLYTISIDSDQDDKTAIANAKVIYNNVQYANGSTLLVPTSVTLVADQNVTATDLSNSDYKLKLTISNNVITAMYTLGLGYVDMGNGIAWATSNITKDTNGNYKLADNPWDYGAYFSWGDTEGHNVAGQNEGYDFSETNYNNGASGSGHNLTASFSSGNATYDAARAKLGDSWRMPTKAEYDWLLNTSNCTNEWVTNYEGSSVVGRLFTSKVNGNKLFFPAAGFYDGTSLYNSGSTGYYWSTEFNSSSNAYFMSFGSSNCSMYYYYRYCGCSVRPVQLPHKNITITLNPTDEGSVDNIQVTVTDSEGVSHSGTTDSNGVATISNVGIGSCTVKAQGKGVSPKTITVATSITSFTLDCYDQVRVSGYIIDQSDPDALAANYIVKDVPAMNSTDEDDVIHRIWSNTKLFAAATSLSNSKLQVRELSRDNKSKWADGTDVVNNTTYDKFMKLPEFWWHCEEVAANTDRWKIDFTMDNPNDESWNHWDGNTFIGVYEAYNSGSLVYSRTGQTPTGSVHWTNFKAYAAARGTGYSLVTYEAHQIMALLGYGWLGTTDDQSIVGYGGNESNKVTGKCDAKGIHDTSAAVDGGNTAGGGSNISINFWGLENWWGNMYEWVDNIQTANSSGLVNILTPGSSTVNRTVQTTTGSSGCITKTTMGDKGDMIPKAYVSDSTYSKGYTSGGFVEAKADTVASRSLPGSAAAGGLGYLRVIYMALASYADIGSRLLYHGDWEENNTLT